MQNKNRARKLSWVQIWSENHPSGPQIGPQNDPLKDPEGVPGADPCLNRSWATLAKLRDASRPIIYY